MKKSLHIEPLKLRLQRMLAESQRFPRITVVYKRGESLHSADALSRAHLEGYPTSAEQLDINLGHVYQSALGFPRQPAAVQILIGRFETACIS